MMGQYPSNFCCIKHPWENHRDSHACPCGVAQIPKVHERKVRVLISLGSLNTGFQSSRYAQMSLVMSGPRAKPERTVNRVIVMNVGPVLRGNFLKLTRVWSTLSKWTLISLFISVTAHTLCVWCIPHHDFTMWAKLMGGLHPPL